MTQQNLALQRAEEAFIGMMNVLANHLTSKAIKLPNDKLTVIDVGAGPMPYGRALERWARSIAKEVRIVAVDPDYLFDSPGKLFYPPWTNPAIEQLALPIEAALSALKGLGVERVDLLTLFNPAPIRFGETPNMRSLDELCRGAPLIGATDGRFSDDMSHELERQMYVVTMFHNQFAPQINPLFGYLYDTIFVAMPKSLT